MEVVSGIEPPSADLPPTWPLPPSRVDLAGDEVHVWSAWPGRAETGGASGLAMLDNEERARAARFHGEEDRKNFAARRSLLRAILGQYLKVAPSQIKLAYEERGKPVLSGPAGAGPLHFSLSHSCNLVLCAVSRSAPPGVDVEKIRPLPEMAGMGAAFFSAQEKARLHAAPPEKKAEVFFRIWTRKEAWLKATGEGVAGTLAQLDCSQPPPGWSLHSLSPAPGYIGALACAGSGAGPLCWRWERPIGQ